MEASEANQVSIRKGHSRVDEILELIDNALYSIDHPEVLDQTPSIEAIALPADSTPLQALEKRTGAVAVQAA